MRHHLHHAKYMALTLIGSIALDVADTPLEHWFWHKIGVSF